jgi:hypothetical protein
MTTRINTLLAAAAALGAAAMFTASAQAGVGPGPNFQQFPSYQQSSSYQQSLRPLDVAVSHGYSEWNRGGQIKDPSFGSR